LYRRRHRRHFALCRFARDFVGGNNADLINGTTFSDGQALQELSFDGVNDRAEVGDVESLKLTSSLTIEGWVRVDTWPTTAAHGHILFRGDDRNGLDPYHLAVTPPGQLK
jgi:hypothetical protein